MKIVIDTNWFDRKLRQAIDRELGPEGWGIVVDLWLWCAEHAPDGDISKASWLTGEWVTGLDDAGMLTGEPLGDVRLRMPPVVGTQVSPKATNSALATKQGITAEDPLSTASVSSQPDCQVVGLGASSNAILSNRSCSNPEKKEKEKKEEKISESRSNWICSGSESQPHDQIDSEQTKTSESVEQLSCSKDQSLTAKDPTGVITSIAVPNCPCQAKNERTINKLEALHCKRNGLTIKKIVFDYVNDNKKTSLDYDAMVIVLQNTFRDRLKVKWIPLLKSLCPVTVGELGHVAEQLRPIAISGDHVSTGLFVRILEETKHGLASPERPRYGRKTSGTRSHTPEYTSDVMALISKLEPLALGENRVSCFLAQTLLAIAKSHGHNLFAFKRCRSAIMHVLPRYTLPDKPNTEMLDPWPLAMKQQSKDEYWVGHDDLRDWIDGIKP